MSVGILGLISYTVSSVYEVAVGHNISFTLLPELCRYGKAGVAFFKIYCSQGLYVNPLE